MTLVFAKLRIGFAEYAVSTPAEASRLYRSKIGDRGASRMPEGTLLDADGEIVGRISFNGRVWSDSTWEPGSTPVYCSSSEA